MEDYEQIEETLEYYQAEEMKKLRENYVTDFTTVAEINIINVHLFAEYFIHQTDMGSCLFEELKYQLKGIE